MDNGALFLIVVVMLMVGWLFEPKSQPPSPAEKLEKAAKEVVEAAVKKATADLGKG